MGKVRKFRLIVEKDEKKLWGRVLVHDNLLVDTALTLPALEKKIRKLIVEFEGFREFELEYAYDLTVFFEQFDFLNQSKIAEIAGINPGLIRQYSSGHKQPSRAQVVKIERAIHQLASRLRSVHLSSRLPA